MKKYKLGSKVEILVFDPQNWKTKWPPKPHKCITDQQNMFTCNSESIGGSFKIKRRECPERAYLPKKYTNVYTDYFFLQKSFNCHE